MLNIVSIDSAPEWLEITEHGLRGLTHWEELLQSVSDFIFSKHCGCTPRGVRGVKRPEIL